MPSTTATRSTSSSSSCASSWRMSWARTWVRLGKSRLQSRHEQGFSCAACTACTAYKVRKVRGRCSNNSLIPKTSCLRCHPSPRCNSWHFKGHQCASPRCHAVRPVKPRWCCAVRRALPRRIPSCQLSFLRTSGLMAPSESSQLACTRSRRPGTSRRLTGPTWPCVARWGQCKGMAAGWDMGPWSPPWCTAERELLGLGWVLWAPYSDFQRARAGDTADTPADLDDQQHHPLQWVCTGEFWAYGSWVCVSRLSTTCPRTSR